MLWFSPRSLETCDRAAFTKTVASGAYTHQAQAMRRIVTAAQGSKTEAGRRVDE